MRPVRAAASVVVAGLTAYSGTAFSSSPDALIVPCRIMAIRTLPRALLNTQVMRIVNGTT